MKYAFLNGEYVPLEEAKIPILDRGVLFADAVYEVVSVIGAQLIDMDRHLARMHRSLGEMSIKADTDWAQISLDLIACNGLEEGLVYLQISRGVAAERDYRWPAEPMEPTQFAFCQSRALINNPLATNGMRIITRPDQRWGRCDIKTTQLLYASMMKMEAQQAGADDAWMERDGLITEGTSQNAHIITQGGTLVTRRLDHRILPGVTRMEMLDRASAMNIQVVERSFSVEEAYDAAEAFVSSSTLLIMPVIEINGYKINGGTPGPVTKALRASYISEVQRSGAI